MYKQASIVVYLSFILLQLFNIVLIMHQHHATSIGEMQVQPSIPPAALSPSDASPAFDSGRRSQRISVLPGDQHGLTGWKVSVRRDAADPRHQSEDSATSHQERPMIQYPSHVPSALYSHRRPATPSDAFHMGKNPIHPQQQQPTAFVGGFIVPPPLPHSHALVPQQSSRHIGPAQSQHAGRRPLPVPAPVDSNHSRSPGTNTAPQASEQPKQPPNIGRQPKRIRVQSVNEAHRVWIDVTPNETGAGLAEKIHTIASFRTMKITSITTASGRSVPLTKQPVFEGWADLQDFRDGEEWKVGWHPQDRCNLVDRIMSRVVHVSQPGVS